jgi:hypothetical protein
VISVFGLDPDTEYAVKKGMTLRIGDQDVSIEYVRTLDSGETVVSASASLPDGTYDGLIVTDSTTPVGFLLGEE